MTQDVTLVDPPAWIGSNTIKLTYTERMTVRRVTGVRFEFEGTVAYTSVISRAASIGLKVGDAVNWTTSFEGWTDLPRIRRYAVLFEDGTECLFEVRQPGYNHGLLLWDPRWSDAQDDRRRLLRPRS